MNKTEFFLDTNIILDYIENRSRETVSFAYSLLHNSDIKVSTSFFNLVETIDKIQEIRHIGKLIVENKYSFDEIIRAKKMKSLSASERKKIMDDINDFIHKNKIEVYMLPHEDMDIVSDIIVNVNIESQDALIVGTYARSEAQIFISNDSNLIKNIEGKVENCFHLKNSINDLMKYIDELKRKK